MGTGGIFLAFMILEFAIMFSGMTMFYDKTNLIQIVFHVMGCVATAMFILNSGHYK
jgi:hypothetical protein